MDFQVHELKEQTVDAFYVYCMEERTQSDAYKNLLEWLELTKSAIYFVANTQKIGNT